MLYDIRLALHYDYPARVSGDRHHIRIAPASIPGRQRVIASALSYTPKPDRQTAFTDFFGTSVASIAYRGSHDELDVRLSARVSVEDRAEGIDFTPSVADLRAELAGLWSVAPDSPHHFTGPSPRVAIDPEITAYADKCISGAQTALAGIVQFGRAIYDDFAYDPDITDVSTTAVEAFELKRGVCQDFSHVMIAGLRGVGIPAGYVSGFLRTIPPPGKPRLEGADAMHAWVRAWCGAETGWIEYDPTNAMLAGSSHITIGYGRDYADISPIVGVLKTSSDQHEATQSVDVITVE